MCNSVSSSTGKLKSMFTNLCLYLEYCIDMLSVSINVRVLLWHVGFFFFFFKYLSEINEDKCYREGVRKLPVPGKKEFH